MAGRRAILATTLFLACVVVLGGEGIPNWPAPATWSPSRSAGVLTAQDVTNPLPFVGLAPCRLLDTRGNGFSGPYGPPSLAAAVKRDFPLAGQCGIPLGAGAVSLNVTVTNTQGPGFIKIYPQGGSAPVVSTLNYVAGQTIANAAVVPLGAGGGVSIVAGVSGTDLVVDTNGYYASSAANQGNTFTVINSGGTTVPAILGQTNSASLNATGVKGVALANGATNGVWGLNFSVSDGADGVFGFAEAIIGVTTGVWGRSASSSDEARGVYGEALATAGRIYGVYGYEASSEDNSAGVRGIDYSGSPSGSSFAPAGVRGESKSDVGVLGVSQTLGVGGVLLDTAGGELSAGFLGFTSDTGVYYLNGLAGTGTKSFVEPHPTDPSKAIRYVCLEGPEAGTYFRGTDQTNHGTAVIQVPESFRLVSDAEGLTVQLTPVGAAATMYVVSQDLNQIVVRSSRDVKFHYMVNGVRKAYPHWDAIQENERFFVPGSASDKLPVYLSEEERGRLIRNGTYNADGTVNMETAERVGWTKMWAEREEQARAAAARFAAQRLRD